MFCSSSFSSLIHSLVLLGAGVALLDDGETDSLVLGERDQRLVLLTQNEDVGGQSGPDVSTAVADLNDLSGSGVGLPGDDDSDASNVATTSGHAKVADVEGDESLDLSSGQINLDDVVHADVRVGVADGAAIVGADEGDASWEQTNLLDLAELEGGLLGEDSVKDKAALGVVQETEVLVGALDLDGVHETSREGGISAHLSVNGDEALHQDEGNLTTSQGILESVTQKDHQRQALAKLVGTGIRTRSLHHMPHQQHQYKTVIQRANRAHKITASAFHIPNIKTTQNSLPTTPNHGNTYKNSAQLVEHPVLGSVQALKVVLGSTRLETTIQQRKTQTHDLLVSFPLKTLFLTSYASKYSNTYHFRPRNETTTDRKIKTGTNEARASVFSHLQRPTDSDCSQTGQ